MAVMVVMAAVIRVMTAFLREEETSQARIVVTRTRRYQVNLESLT